MDKYFKPEWIKISPCPLDYIPADGEIFVGVDPAVCDYTVKGFVDCLGVLHIQEVIPNEQS